MRIIARATFGAFGAENVQAATQLEAWYAIASNAAWKSPADIKQTFANASIIGSDRAVSRGSLGR
ncbi:MAG: type II toxin-antitoxin system HigB family toxin [Clostridia bacterium]|nr:type II toxin-antitoxin system HigB family toxin [Deltaproteobacteria bacterium]